MSKQSAASRASSSCSKNVLKSYRALVVTEPDDSENVVSALNEQQGRHDVERFKVMDGARKEVVLKDGSKKTAFFVLFYGGATSQSSASESEVEEGLQQLPDEELDDSEIPVYWFDKDVVCRSEVDKKIDEQLIKEQSGVRRRVAAGDPRSAPPKS
mmetsp:Transcript_10593/g.25830  ORF Transcript_10593/g.25830 Transcript_10593/m.25830 type:complete len:156 (-) Transcript_10593:235-702(-)